MKSSAFTVSGLTAAGQTGSGGVVAVQGTANQINVTDPTGAPTISLSPSVLSQLAAIENQNSPALRLSYNGGLNLWQRGTSFTLLGPVSQYTADRLQVKVGGTIPITVKQVTGQSPNTFALQAIRTASTQATGQIDIGQSWPLSLVALATGQPQYLRVWLKVGANFSGTNGQLTLSITGGVGTNAASQLGSGFNSQTTVATLAITPSTSLQVFTLPYTLASQITQAAFDIAWVATGTSGADDSVTVDSFYAGSNPQGTPTNDIARDLIECQPFYQKSYPLEIAPATANAPLGAEFNPNGGYPAMSFLGQSLFVMRMRAAPSVAVFGVFTGTQNVVSSLSNDLVAGSGVPQAINSRGFRIYNSANSAPATTTGLQWHYVADSELY